MRIILVAAFLIIFFIISIPLFLIMYIIGRFHKRSMVAISQAIVVTAFHVVLFLSGVKITKIGKENIPKNEGVLYVANHRSYFDVPVAYVSIPTLTGFVAKKEISRIPFLRTWMRFLQCLFLDRDNIKEGLKMILQGIEQIKEGYSVFISPEGTRSQGDDMLPFKEGSFKMAEKTGCAIIPVSISNTDALFEKHKPWVRSAHVIIEFGKPIYVNELEKEQRKFLGSYVQEIIRTTLKKNSSMI
ncbi:MAG: hypothetical protein K0S47_616 [Herbinix sp.]|jgi:1-acyl-sn-glycerol-3-phosphate acyltransferase|nr:hypothetical protein [Herbinix sp.]